MAAGPYTGGPTTVASSLDYDQTAWELKAYYALRPQLYFDAVSDVKTTDQSYVGSAVTFTIQSDLAAASTALNESTDVTPVAMADSQVTLTLAEYGNAIQLSALELGTSFIPLDPVAANVIGFNAGLSIDTVARDVLKAGTNVRYSLGTGVAPLGRSSVTPSNTFGAADVRRARVDLVDANVPQIGNLYCGFMHPDVSYDLRGTTGSSAWRDPHTYSQPGEIWSGEIGVFEGVRFIETPRAPLFADAGSSTTLTDVYRTIFLGRQALAKTWSTANGNGDMPRIFPTPIIDMLRRFPGMAWYWLGAYGIFRQASVRGVESASSVGAN